MAACTKKFCDFGFWNHAVAVAKEQQERLHVEGYSNHASRDAMRLLLWHDLSSFLHPLSLFPSVDRFAAADVPDSDSDFLLFCLSIAAPAAAPLTASFAGSSSPAPQFPDPSVAAIASGWWE